MQIVGYTDQWSVRPGQSIGLHVSSRVGEFDASFVRLQHGDDNPAGPGFKADRIPSLIDGRYTAQWHDVPVGSYAIIDAPGETLDTPAATVTAWIWPTAPGGGCQTVMARGVSGFRIFIDEDGRAAMAVGTSTVSAPETLQTGQW
ncbi:MAG: hypothetical protein WBO17_00880, partial [Sphingorhabdus sp.]